MFAVDQFYPHMKKILFPILSAGLVLTVLTSSSLSSSVQRPTFSGHDETEFAEDSAVAVIAWFNKRDTMTYWVNESTWEIDGKDTVKTAEAAMKVMLTVTDSTSKGYRMEYRFLEFAAGNAEDSEMRQLTQNVISKLQESTVGTAIRFRTDELGQITKYENLNEIRKQAKSVLEYTVSEMPFIDSLEAAGVDTRKLLKSIDTDAMVESYTEEIELMFQCHGGQFPAGEFSEHEDETDEQYASDTYMYVAENPDTYEYEILMDVNSYIPRDAVKTMLGDLVDALLDDGAAQEARENLDSEFDNQVTEDAVHNSYLYMKYFPDGWPEEIVSQEKTTIGDKGKLIQKYISWDYRSVGNF